MCVGAYMQGGMIYIFSFYGPAETDTRLPKKKRTVEGASEPEQEKGGAENGAEPTAFEIEEVISQAKTQVSKHHANQHNTPYNTPYNTHMLGG